MGFVVFLGIVALFLIFKFFLKAPSERLITSLTPSFFDFDFNFFIPKLDDDSVNVLEQYSRYYRMLSPDQKILYGYRIIKFLEDKEFVKKDSLDINNMVRVLIADSAVKLTAGLKYFKFSDFEKIILFKGEFYSDVTKLWEKGEANPRGAIVMSWKDFLEGDLNDHDNINLGLHEYAHALMIQSLHQDKTSDAYFDSMIGEYEDTSKAPGYMEKIKASNIFRNYAFRNNMEFFAVAVEHFFETPCEFHKANAELYSLISRMLNQDTAAMFEEPMRPNEAEDDATMGHRAQSN